MSRKDPHIKHRFPDTLREKVREAAQVAGRSMNAEVVHRLEASFFSIAQRPDHPSSDGCCDECFFSRRNSHTNCFRFPRPAGEFLVVNSDGWCGEYLPKGGAV